MGVQFNKTVLILLLMIAVIAIEFAAVEACAVQQCVANCKAKGYLGGVCLGPWMNQHCSCYST